ncbi:MAG: PTS system mannose-specific EIIAB component [Calditrichaeota bacterium]|nr:PTS system mannose-specific EIIAB component [Calditrichota bacterium]
MGSQSETGNLTGLVVRVDDRLIHGQILYGWAHAWADEVWLANDRVAGDDHERALYEEQIAGLDGGVITVDQAIARYGRRECGDRRCLLILARCDDLRRIVEAGAKPSEIHLANLGEEEGRVRVAETVALSAEDIRILRRLRDEGHTICLRKLPQSKTKPVRLPQ